MDLALTQRSFRFRSELIKDEDVGNPQTELNG